MVLKNVFFIFFISLVLLIQKAGAQQPCTSVNSITINTGFNPINNSVIGVGQNDANWIVTAISPMMQTIPGAGASVGQGAFVIAPYVGSPSWATSLNSRYISCINTNVFRTPFDPNNAYTMTVTRNFRTCATDTYQFSLNIACDNFITSINVDGGISQFSQSNVNNFAAFEFVNFSLSLNPGLHNITVTLQNSTNVQAENQNFFGLNIFGNISGTTNSIAGPTCNNVCPTNCSDTCYWKVTGNNIIGGNNILGTLTNDDIKVFSSNAQRGVIKADGKFGWKTPSPSTLFHINCANPVEVPSNIRLENLSNGSGNPLVIDANGYILRGNRVINPSLTNNCGVQNFVTKTGSPGFLECSQIYDDGTFVGIATTTPYFVNGSLSTLNVNGLTVSTSFFSVSDKKYKQNIETIKDATSIINKLRGVTYSWNKNAFPDKKFGEGLQAGFIAQEIESVYPVAVANDGKNGYLVNYSSFIPLLTQGQQELNKKLEELTIQNLSLQSEIIELGNQLKGFQNSLGSGSNLSTNLNNKNNLYQNRPNPFNNTTTIDYSISSVKSSAYVIVYDLTGRELLRFKIANNGKGSINNEANQLAKGMYLYSLVIDGVNTDTRKMTLVGN